MSRPPSSSANSRKDKKAGTGQPKTAHPESDSEGYSSDEKKSSNRPSFVRRTVVNHDTNIDLILAGRVKKVSIELPSVTKAGNHRMEGLTMANEKDYKHLLGEVNGGTYDINGRPEIDMLVIGYKKALPDGKEDPNPFFNVLYYTSKSLFIITTRVENMILAKLLEMQPDNELVIISSFCMFGDYQYNTLDSKRQKVRALTVMHCLCDPRLTYIELCS